VEINYDVYDDENGGNVLASGQPWLYEVSSSFYGTIILDEDEETNGVAYLLTGYSLDEIHFNNILDEWGSILTNRRMYGWESSPGIDWASIKYFYKIDDTHFSFILWQAYVAYIYFATLYVDENGNDRVSFSEPVTQDYTYSLSAYYIDVPWNYHWFSDLNGHSIYGGRYCATLIGIDDDWVLSLIDMQDGSRSDTEIISGITDWIKYPCLISSTQSPNYMYFGIVNFPSRTETAAYTYYFYPILVNKNNGNINYTEIECAFNDGGPWTPHFYGSIYINYIEYNSTFKKRGGVYYVINENPDTGEGTGFFITGAMIMDDSVSSWAEWYYISYIRINTDLSYELNKYVDVIKYLGGGSYEISQIETPEWMYTYGIDSQMFPTFSRNVSDSPMYWGSVFYEYPWVDAEGYDEHIIINSDFSNYNIIELDPIWHSYASTLDSWNAGSFAFGTYLDEEDDILYIAFPKDSYTHDKITTGYNLDGTINRIMFLYHSYYYYDWGDGDIEIDDNVEIIGGGIPYQNKIISSYQSTYYKYVNFWYFGHPASGVYINGYPSYKILLHDPEILPSGSFNVIYEMDNLQPLYVEASKNLPTVLFDNQEDYKYDYNSSDLVDSFSNEWGSFKRISPNSNIQDVRVFDIADPFSLFPASGTVSGFFNRYIGVAARKKGLIMYGAELPDNKFKTITISGVFTHLDFTNNDPDPCVFVSTSGITTTSGRFLQRNSEAILWNDYSFTLPSGYKITVIRADDRM
jgi:hypothetical protein